jgi:hypothetical protein
MVVLLFYHFISFGHGSKLPLSANRHVCLGVDAMVELMQS